ncbi:MAG: tetratricopeptide repeat protein [Leptolyngbyaceae cyanobacterium CRU_2_3]|nr:tetratricopeptide repeat protein [Leptolyngbyaceae cyanobacterium CRU_2_3]
MPNQTFTLATTQPSQNLSIPAPVAYIAEWGIVLLLVTGMSWFVNRKRSSSIPPNSATQSQVLLGLETLQFNQPLQWVSYGKQLERSRQYLAAIAVYNRGINQYPNDFHLWHERGLALAKLQRFEEAIASYDQAYQIRPEQRDLAHERGDALLQLGRYEEAIDCFDVFLRYAPGNTHVLADRGYALVQLGCYQEALRSLEAVLKGNRWERTPTAYARYYQIEALRQSGQLKAALQSAAIAVKQHPEERFQAQYAALKHQLDQVT